jgi:hypothetical protein
LFFLVSYRSIRALCPRLKAKRLEKNPMPSQTVDRHDVNLRLARALACAVNGADKPRHRIASEAGMLKNTLLRVIRGARPIGLDEAERIFLACGVPARSVMVLALTGHEDLAAKWMFHGMAAFLEEFMNTLPANLEETLGERISDLRPRWATGTSRLVARMLAKHIDDFADRDLSFSDRR